MADTEDVPLGVEQRTLVWRRNTGWVKCKLCDFCAAKCHMDQAGQWAYGRYRDSPHQWYCSTQCRNHYSAAHLRSLLKG